MRDKLLTYGIGILGIVLVAVLVARNYTVGQAYMDKCISEHNTETACVFMLQHRNLYQVLLDML